MKLRARGGSNKTKKNERGRVTGDAQERGEGRGLGVQRDPETGGLYIGIGSLMAAGGQERDPPEALAGVTPTTMKK